MVLPAVSAVLQLWIISSVNAAALSNSFPWELSSLFTFVKLAELEGHIIWLLRAWADLSASRYLVSILWNQNASLASKIFCGEIRQTRNTAYDFVLPFNRVLAWSCFWPFHTFPWKLNQESWKFFQAFRDRRKCKPFCHRLAHLFPTKICNLEFEHLIVCPVINFSLCHRLINFSFQSVQNSESGKFIMWQWIANGAGTEFFCFCAILRVLPRFSNFLQAWSQWRTRTTIACVGFARYA